MSQQVLTQYAPLVKVSGIEMVPVSAIGGQTREGKDEIITGAGNMVWDPDAGMWVPVSEANPLEARVRHLESLIGKLDASKETDPDAASATLLALLRGLLATVAGTVDNGAAKVTLTGTNKELPPGLASERPAASAENKGKTYWAVDTGEVWVSTGTAWRKIGDA